MYYSIHMKAREMLNRFTRSILYPVAVYTLFGIAWITLSDRILLLLVRSPDLLSRIQTYKGWFFIFITALLLYSLMKDHRNRVLSERNEQEKLLMNVPLPLISIEGDGTISLVNPAFTRIYGYRHKDIPDYDTWTRAAYPDLSYRSKVTEQWAIMTTSQEEALSPARTFTVRAKDGRDKAVEFSLLGRNDARLVICKDVTEPRRRAREREQEDKMRALGQLAGGIAHDFNNQLGAIMGFTDLLLLSLEKDTEEYDFLQSIIDASGTAARLTKELLSYSRKSRIELAPVNMERILNEIVHIAERTFPTTITLDVHCSHKGKMDITGNASLLKSMFLNLLLNARDAMPRGGKIKIGLTSVWRSENMNFGLYAKEGLYLMAEIEDEGMGIPREHLSHIFEPFYTTKDKNKGTGMGLAMVYSTLQSHKGSIEVESAVGNGTCFRLFFPTNLTLGS